MIDSVYFNILKDSFWGNFAPTVSGEFAYKIILYYGKHDNILASLFALIGSVGGLTVTYLLFFALAKLMKKILDRNPSYPQAQHYISKYSPILGILTIAPQLCVIPAFFFGFAKMNFKKFLMITIFYRLVYYIFMVSTTHPLIS